MSTANEVQLTLPMVAWMSLVHTFQNTPEGVLAPDVQADVDALALGKESRLVKMIQDNSEKVGKPSKKKGQKFYVPLHKEVTATMTRSQVETIGAVLQMYVREQGTPWSVDAERRVQAVMQMHILDPEAVVAQ